MERTVRNLFTSKLSIIGLFTSVIILLTIPLVVLLSQQRQELRGKAAQPPSPTPLSISPGFGIISGYVYYDDNKDGDRKAEEKPFPGVTVRVKQIKEKAIFGDNADNISDVKTDSNGYFRFRFSRGSADPTSYSVKVVLPDGYKTVNTNPLIISDLLPNTQKIVEFGLYSLKPLPSLTPKITLSPKGTSGIRN